jgi:hypothetical protein
MNMLKTIEMLEVLKWLLFKYGKFERLQFQEVDMVFIFIIEYRNVVLSRRMRL